MPAEAPPLKLFLFVYGSLKSGFRHHAELRGAPRRRSARTLPLYRLVRAARYPVLLDDGRESVSGELYRVTEELLRELDRFEGDDYRRQVVLLDDGSRAIAYLGDSAAFADHSPISGGVWRE